jgi:hypothetical protein
MDGGGLTTRTRQPSRMNEEIKGSNSFYQRLKRMVFKVPYYNTGSELAALVAAKKAAK